MDLSAESETFTQSGAATTTATLYRMATDDHTCPFGLKARHLLRQHGFTVDDRVLTSREESADFKASHGVETTPQAFIAGERIGGYEDLLDYFGIRRRDEGTTYRPVIAIFGMAAAMALALTWLTIEAGVGMRPLQWFVAMAMCLLAVQKLQDLNAFTNTFLGYDLLAQRYVPYAYFYPFAEATAGVLMIANVLTWIAAPLAIFIGGVGAASVIKAVYIEKRELRCACVGGNSDVPLGPVSLTENVLMVVMGVWMLV